MTSVPPDYRKLADQCERLAERSSQGEYNWSCLNQLPGLKINMSIYQRLAGHLEF